ncbi:hypothetical protein PGT21_034508 [Puccinia graminis f. sp. tritici]|uniref:Uncharacterized protein n=1 Tax=Puccinia graminis f. sp. tritici TaxID=56615 RepID=A0A5B0N7M5_PUCGR|nr:hypothetical protein PGTUg99_017719 [Puccinia graminis f. sp. tritici]KAA1084706.1 hypothetical protein PGT21_034508 [Puccinia graminis f. sp. tritici]
MRYSEKGCRLAIQCYNPADTTSLFDILTKASLSLQASTHQPCEKFVIVLVAGSRASSCSPDSQNSPILVLSPNTEAASLSSVP